jgi:integrase
MFIHLLEEFQLDWKLSGKAHRTVELYSRDLHSFLTAYPEPTLAHAKAWLASTESPTVRRKRGQALRALGSWCSRNAVDGLEWAHLVPLAVEPITPQQTATEGDYRAALAAAGNTRDRAVVELLWSCGLRRAELAALTIADVDLVGGYVIVRKSKTGKPRIAPLSPAAILAVRRLMRGRHDGNLLGMTGNAIRLMLQRIQAPSAHAWRRGWVVRALRMGVSETSVKVAAGWTSGAMVSRYSLKFSAELAVSEFQNRWNPEVRLDPLFDVL